MGARLVENRLNAPTLPLSFLDRIDASFRGDDCDSITQRCRLTAAHTGDLGKAVGPLMTNGFALYGFWATPTSDFERISAQTGRLSEISDDFSVVTLGELYFPTLSR